MKGAPWGGSEELWSRSALCLRKRGHDVITSSLRWPNPAPRLLELRSAGIAVTYQKPLSRTLAARAWRKTAGKVKWGTDERARWLKKHRPDFVVVSQGANLDGIQWMATCARLSVPYFAVVQCNSECWWPKADQQEAVAAAYRGARRVYCVSRRNLELLEDQLGEELSNAKVIRNPVNLTPGDPVPWPGENEICKIACVARLDTFAKGQDLLIRVMARDRWKARPVRMTLYGKGSSELRLRSLAENLGIADRIAFAGHVDDIRDVWARNELLVLPSRFEGLPLALVEAMYCARPAVVTDVGGNAEACVDGETGYIAGAPSTSLLDQALERAWAERCRWPMMGQAARSRVEQLNQRDPVEAFCDDLEDWAAGRPA